MTNLIINADGTFTNHPKCDWGLGEIKRAARARQIVRDVFARLLSYDDKLTSEYIERGNESGFPIVFNAMFEKTQPKLREQAFYMACMLYEFGYLRP